MKLSIIIPALNEEKQIHACLNGLQPIRERGHEVILVDGGSQDQTCKMSNDLVDRVVHARMGRASQMNTGAKSAGGDIFLFLHADTVLSEDADYQIIRHIKDPDYYWGRFDIRLSGQHWLFRMIERFMNMRTRLTSINTGDHAIFISKALFNQIGGYEEIPLMEDISLSRKLKCIVKPVNLRQTVITSSRRWETRGIIRTLFTMWYLRLLYFFGIHPEQLVRKYV